MTNEFPANIDSWELSQIFLICKIRRHVTRLGLESTAAKSLQLDLVFLRAVLVSRRVRGWGMKGMGKGGRSNRNTKGPDSFLLQVGTCSKTE